MRKIRVIMSGIEMQREAMEFDVNIASIGIRLRF